MESVLGLGPGVLVQAKTLSFANIASISDRDVETNEALP